NQLLYQLSYFGINKKNYPFLRTAKVMENFIRQNFVAKFLQQFLTCLRKPLCNGTIRAKKSPEIVPGRFFY
ncbi:MAG: hypothetical protein WCL56_11850, partial [Sediminibacterium sp.]